MQNQSIILALNSLRSLKTAIVLLHQRPLHLHHFIILPTQLINLFMHMASIFRFVKNSILYFILLVPLHNTSLFLLLQYHRFLSLLICRQFLLSELLDPFLILLLLHIYQLASLGSTLHHALPRLSYLLPYLFPQNIVLLFHLGWIIYPLQRFFQLLLLLTYPWVNIVVMLYPFLLVYGLIPLVLIMTLNDFKSVPHHLDVQLHFFQLSSRPPGITLHPSLFLNFTLSLNSSAFCLATFHYNFITTKQK